jgi:hypothetical protein
MPRPDAQLDTARKAYRRRGDGCLGDRPGNEEVMAWHAQLKSAKSLNARTKTQGKHKAYDKGRDWGLEKAMRAYKKHVGALPDDTGEEELANMLTEWHRDHQLQTDGRQASVDQEFRQAQAAMKRNLNPLLVPENSSAIAEYREEKVVQVIHPLQYKRVS